MEKININVKTKKTKKKTKGKQKEEIMMENLFRQEGRYPITLDQTLIPPKCPECGKSMRWNILVDLFGLKREREVYYLKILENLPDYAKCGVCDSICPKDTLNFNPKKGYYHSIEPIVGKCPIF